MQDSRLDFEHLSVILVWWGGFVLLAIGLLKLTIYAVLASKPRWLDRIGSVTLRQFLAGRGNRLAFGWGGFITAAVGGFFMVAAKAIDLLMERLSL